MAITLMDGVARNAEYPDTFEIPTDAEKAAVKPGTIVKLGFTDDNGTERMWVKVTGPGTGILDNDPFTVGMQCGDAVTFEPRNILSIWED